MCRFVKDSNDWYYDKKLSLRDKKLSLRVEGKCWKKKKNTDTVIHILVCPNKYRSCYTLE